MTDTFARVPLNSVMTVDRKGIDPSAIDPACEYIGLDSIGSDGLIKRGAVAGSADLRSSKHQFTEKHVLFGKLRPYLRKVAAPDFRGVCSTDIIPLLPKDLVDRRYLLHWLRTDEIIGLATKESAGANLPRLSPTALLRFDIPLPPFDEQKRIAAVLDKADALRRQRQESLHLTEKLLQSVFLDMFGEPEANPYGFAVGTIGDLLSSANYGTSQKAGEQGAWPVLRMGNITYSGGWDFSSMKYLDLSPTDERKYLVRKGHILFNRTNSKELVGKTAVFREDEPMAFAGYLIRCEVNDRADPEYISAYLNSAHGKRTLMSMCKAIVGMANINAKELQAIPIPHPPVELQRKFAERVRALLDHRRTLETTALLDTTLFSSLQQRAFNGELDLSKLALDVDDVTPSVSPFIEVNRVPSRYSRKAIFIAPPEIEARLLEMEKRLDANSEDDIEWSEDFFKYRVLGQSLAVPFSFKDIWDEAYLVMRDPPYEQLKKVVFAMIESGELVQSFHGNPRKPDAEPSARDPIAGTDGNEMGFRNEIVFYPRA